MNSELVERLLRTHTVFVDGSAWGEALDNPDGPDAAARITELQEEVERRSWQPIETAPKDGRYILIATGAHDGGMTTACWDAEWSTDGWWLLDDGKNFEIPLRGPDPTHWQPLPSPPARTALQQSPSSAQGGGDG